ncbi:MAG: class I SAM-dependent methyltransferase [Terriglobia bacterium]
MHPRPERETLQGLYTERYFEQGTYQGRYSETHGQPDHIPPVWTKILLACKRRQPQGRLLDIGCAHGFFLYAAAQHGFTPCGVELVPEAVAHARSLGYSLHCGDLHSARYQTNSFDVVTMLDVIEHLWDPLEEVKEVARVLRPGGLFGVLTPNAWQTRLRGMRWRGFRQSFEHVLFFEPNTIAHLLRIAGFEVVETFTCQPNLAAGWVRRVGTSLKIDALSVARQARLPVWKKALRKQWQALNRAALWLPEELLFGHMLFVLARLPKRAG